MFKIRLSKIRKKLNIKQIDGLLVTLPINCRYLSGFIPDNNISTELSTLLLITQTTALLFTDPRYEFKARAQSRYFITYIYYKNLFFEIKQALINNSVKSLAYESESLLNDQKQNLENIISNNVKLIPTKKFVEDIRAIKDYNEIQTITNSLNITEKILSKILKNNLIGKSEKELALIINQELKKEKTEGNAFLPIIASSYNAATPHAQPTNRIIQPKDIIIFDIGTKVNGYNCDISRTVIAGGAKNADPYFRKIYSIVYKAQQQAISMIKPGMQGSEADELARKVINKAGYNEFFNHSLGHGIGLTIHETPSLSPNSNDILKPGMIFTIEPGIYLPGWGGIRLESMAILTKHGCKILDNLEKLY